MKKILFLLTALIFSCENQSLESKKKTVDQLKNAIESLNVSKDNLVLANEVYNVSEKKYKEGIGSNLEVLDSNNALKTAQTNYYNAYYQAIISKINLEKTLGILN